MGKAIIPAGITSIVFFVINQISFLSLFYRELVTVAKALQTSYCFASSLKNSKVV